MKILLLADVKEIGGRKGQVKDVSEGYARNYLLRLGLARALDKSGLAQAEDRAKALVRHEQEYISSLKLMGVDLAKLHVEFQLKTGPKGVVFGSVNADDIIEKVRSIYPKLDATAKALLERPIKEAGDHRVVIALPRGVRCEITLSIRPLA